MPDSNSPTHDCFLNMKVQLFRAKPFKLCIALFCNTKNPTYNFILAYIHPPLNQKVGFVCRLLTSYRVTYSELFVAGETST